MRAARSIAAPAPSVASVALATAPEPAIDETLPVTADDLRDYMPIVHQVVARFLCRLPPNVLRDDVMSAGVYGLIDSLRKNGGARGPAFEWYARVRIRGAILDELRAQDWLTRRARQRSNDATARGGVACSVVALEDLSDASKQSLVSETAPSPLELAEQSAEREGLAEAVKSLPERERLVIEQHYFRGLQLKAVAEELGVSEPRVSQLHARALGRLREALRARAA